MKQTAVEWLVDYIENQNKNGYEFHPKYNEHIVQQAKEIEKQQKGYSEGDMLKSFHCGKLYQGREGHIYFEQLINKLKNK